MGRVIVLGSINLDMEVRVDHHPSPGEKVMGETLMKLAGGKGANQAVAARATGAQVIMVGAVGDDAAGGAYLDRLASKGIQLAVERVPNTPTGHALITTDGTGMNEIVVVPGANKHVSSRALDPIRELGPEDILLAQTETPVETVTDLVRFAAERGVRIVLNLSPYVELPADVLACADPLIVHEEDVSRLEAAGLTARSTVVTHGKRGADWDGEHHGGTVVPDEMVVDTIGAGDAFCGALAAALSMGQDRSAALDAALRAAAENVRHFGAQPEPILGSSQH